MGFAHVCGAAAPLYVRGRDRGAGWLCRERAGFAHVCGVSVSPSGAGNRRPLLYPYLRYYCGSLRLSCHSRERLIFSWSACQALPCNPASPHLEQRREAGRRKHPWPEHHRLGDSYPHQHRCYGLQTLLLLCCSQSAVPDPRLRAVSTHLAPRSLRRENGHR